MPGYIAVICMDPDYSLSRRLCGAGCLAFLASRQVVVDLSRVLAVKILPVIRNRWYHGAASVLHVDPGWRGKRADVFESLATQRERLVPVWWIQKHDVERRSLPIGYEFKGVCPYDLCSACAESVDVRLQLLYYPNILVDENDGFGAARQGLETENWMVKKLSWKDDLRQKGTSCSSLS